MTSNVRLIAELQALQIGLVIVGGDLNRLPEVMRLKDGDPSTCGIPQGMNPESPAGQP